MYSDTEQAGLLSLFLCLQTILVFSLGTSCLLAISQAVSYKASLTTSSLRSFERSILMTVLSRTASTKFARFLGRVRKRKGNILSPCF